MWQRYCYYVTVLICVTVAHVKTWQSKEFVNDCPPCVIRTIAQRHVDAQRSVTLLSSSATSSCMLRSRSPMLLTSLLMSSIYRAYELAFRPEATQYVYSFCSWDQSLTTNLLGTGTFSASPFCATCLARVLTLYARAGFSLCRTHTNVHLCPTFRQPCSALQRAHCTYSFLVGEVAPHPAPARSPLRTTWRCKQVRSHQCIRREVRLHSKCVHGIRSA